MKVAVCETTPELTAGSAAWNTLRRVLDAEGPDLFVLNEMPFGKWIAAAPTVDDDVWKRACDVHEEGVARLHELGCPVVVASRARELEGRRVNEAFVWTPSDGARGAHTKQFFPDEEGYYEARWFEGGDRHFNVVPAGELGAGFLLCTEVMFNEYARHYGRGGAQVILAPRAGGKASLHRWLVAMRMAAIVSGCYVLTSNRGGTDSNGQIFGGRGWVIDPEGDLVAQTSESTPVVFHELDKDCVTRAQGKYPCYIKE
jgi:N-carbamoylputrescine amidase